MNKTIAYVIYYLVAIVSCIFLVDFFKSSIFQSVLIGIAVGISFSVFVRPMIDIYIRK